ncbi:hypothetical protein MHBO_000714 [Bonamia ostreae]|uniref:Uncharacterized protein n=1 Tax=Bonamia ostreae TaxID=126728 RepID=A0ABV2AGP0_9EUKA
MEISEDVTKIINLENLEKLIKITNLQDFETNLLKPLKVYRIEKARSSLYKKFLKIPDKTVLLGAITANAQLEYVLVLRDDQTSIEIATTNCGISYDTISPSQLVEYCYHKGKWQLSNISLESLGFYRASKFSFWKKLLLEPTCKAQFRRTLRQGMVNRMFDRLVFRMPEEEQKNWQVEDENGKRVYIPRPVEALRIFDAATRRYKDVSPILDDAPSDEEAPKWWTEFLVVLREKHGADFIEEILRD